MPKRPVNARREAKRRRKRKKEDIVKETNELKEKIKGNPHIVEAIRKLEERIELLEEKL